MAKVKLGKWEIEEDELEQQHLAARQQGEAERQTELQAQQVTYDRAKEQLVIELKNGIVILLPRHLLQGLQDVPAEQIAALQVGPRGASLHWESLGLSFSLGWSHGRYLWHAGLDARTGPAWRSCDLDRESHRSPVEWQKRWASSQDYRSRTRAMR